MMSTLSWIFGTRGGPGGAGDIAEDDAEAVGSGVVAWASADTGAGGRVGDGGGDGTRQQALCLTPIARKCCEKKDWARYVDHSSESSCYYTHSSDMSCQLIHWCACGGHAVSFHRIN